MLNNLFLTNLQLFFSIANFCQFLMINNDQQCTEKSTIIVLPELSVYYLIPYRHESDIRRIFIFDWIFFVLAGNKENHNISDELEFRLGLTSDCGVSCP